MKINPVAIQSYQQAIRREDAAGSQRPDDNQVADAGKKVQIAPQNEGAESTLAWLLSLMTLQKLYADEILKQPPSPSSD